MPASGGSASVARVASLGDFDFPAFIRERASRRPGSVLGNDHGYAYVSDRNTRATFRRLRPVELAVAAAVRTFKNVGKAELLGHAVKIGPRQFPRVHALAERCAETLGIPAPTVYVVSNPHLNAATYGTNEDAFILVNSALMDHFNDAELLSVIGHECGHIHNNHVVYLTAMHYLTNVAGVVLRNLAVPALLSLRAWSRRAVDLLVEHVGGHQREYDRRVRFDHEAWRIDSQLAPSDLLAGRRAAVRTVRGRRIRDLAKVAPNLHLLLQILIDQRHHTDREVTRDATADLEETNVVLGIELLVPLDQGAHVFGATAHDGVVVLTADHAGHE